MEPVSPVEPIKEVEQNITEIKKSTLGFYLIAAVIVAVMIYFMLAGFNAGDQENKIKVDGSTFYDTGDEILLDNSGRPYVILFSTTWCPHCQWIAETFDSLANESFASQINLQHWQLDTGDNTLTPLIIETEVPSSIRAIFDKYNPEGSIPTFVFGGKYIRVGTGYEAQNDLNAELEDFKLIIGKLLG